MVNLVSTFLENPTNHHFSCKVIPHITNEIQDWIERVAIVPVDGEVDPADVCIIELGGTIGDKRQLTSCILVLTNS